MTNAEWTDLYRVQRPIARARTCVGCGKLGCRVAVTEDDVPEADVLCCGCFENSDHDFKLRRQWFFRACVKAGLSAHEALVATYEKPSEAVS